MRSEDVSIYWQISYSLFQSEGRICPLHRLCKVIVLNCYAELDFGVLGLLFLELFYLYWTKLESLYCTLYIIHMCKNPAQYFLLLHIRYSYFG